MPTVAYYSVKPRNLVKKSSDGKVIAREMHVPCYTRLKVKVKNRDEALAIRERKDFVRFACGPFTMEELIDRQMSIGKSDWYV